MPRRHVQLSLDDARRPTGRGGWRPGAGDRAVAKVAHEQRDDFPARYPQHVTLRVLDGVPSLRYGIDRFSSGAWFDGWADDRAEYETIGMAQPTAAATTWLLRTGWKRRGLLGFDEIPRRRRRGHV